MATIGSRRYCCSRLCLILAFLCTLGISREKDTLRQGDSIRDGETLVSANGVFQVGFFSPRRYGSDRYLGIWYNNISPATVVWAASRPVNGTSGVFALDSRGDLVIVDGRANRNITIYRSSGDGTSNLILFDTGNLVLRGADANQVWLWQSFDYPTDTWLPGMKLGRTGGLSNRALTSWSQWSGDYPSAGNFTFQAEGRRLVIISRLRRTVAWRSEDLLQGSSVNDVISPWESYSPDTYLTFINKSDTGEAYFRFEASALTRIVMDVGGQVKLYSRTLSGSLTVCWAAPDVCLEGPSCGPNGICDSAAASPTRRCRCMDGFQPTSSGRWNSGDWSGGCTRRVPATCGAGGARLVPVLGVAPPVMYGTRRSTNSNRGCEDLCLGDCSCSAYALSYRTRPGCFLWFGDLPSLQAAYSAEAELYVRFAAADAGGTPNQRIPPVGSLDPPGTNSDNGSEAGRIRLLVIALPLLFVTVLLCGVAVCCIFRRKRAGHREGTGEELLLRDIGIDGAVTYKFVDVHEVGGERGPEIYLYSFSNVQAATNNFSDDNKLGEGGFGPVYKGKLLDGQEIAIKRLSTRSGQGLEEFKTEIVLVARLQHKNLVRLLGCCVQGDERLLLYEYMLNGSLDFFLFDPGRAVQLDWSRRVHIIEGIAQGLLYLHKYSRLTIIHRDLKASNVLLDNEMNPKISDFGMARIFSSNEHQANTNRIVGTYGYMSPEYAMEGLFSIKSDVFSFGVLLLEIVSGRKNTGSDHYFSFPRSLLGYAWELWNAGRELELTDPSLGDSYPSREVSRCVYVGLMCVQEYAEDRPSMAEVVTLLGGESSTHQAPKQPAFLTPRPPTYKSSSSTSAATSSIYGVTVSAVEGR